MNMGMDDFHANNNAYFCQFEEDPSLPPLPETFSSSASDEMLLQHQVTNFGYEMGCFSSDDQLIGMQPNYPVAEDPPLPPLPETFWSSASNEMLLQSQGTSFGYVMGCFSCDDRLIGMQPNQVADVNMNHRRARSEIITFPISDFNFDETNQQENYEVRPHVQRRREISASKLEEIARVDPKKARRVHANRQAALRSKVRKDHHVNDLEQQVQTLQAQVASLSTELDLSQNQVYTLTSANTRLMAQLETMDLQIRLRDAQNDALRNEIEELKKQQAQ